MKRLGTVNILIEKLDSKFVPFDVVYLKVEAENDDTEQEIKESVTLLETDQIGLPEFGFEMEVGDMVSFSADFFGEYFSYWTDCGTEHDANFEFQNVTDLRVWKCVHEQASVIAVAKSQGDE